MLLGGSFLVIYYIHLVLFKTHFHTKCLITSKGYYKVIVLNVHARVILSVHYLFLHNFRYNSSMRFGNDFKITIEKLEGSFYFPLEVSSMIQGVIGLYSTLKWVLWIVVYAQNKYRCVSFLLRFDIPNVMNFRITY